MASANGSTFLDGLLGRLRIAASAVLKPSQPTLNFIGATVVDNPGASRTDVTIPASTAAAPVANIAALKALSTLDSTVVDGQTRVVLSDNDGVPWVYSADQGATSPGDDRTNVRPTDVLTANAGRWLKSTTSPILDSYAHVRLAVTGAHGVLHVRGRTAAGDSAGGIFDKKLGTPPTDNDGTVLVPTGVTTFWYERRFSGELHAEWWGVVANGKIARDAVLTASSNTISSATAAFKTTDEGKRGLVRMPSHPSTNTITLTAGNNVFSGTDLDVDFATLLGSGVPRTGAGIAAFRDDANVITYRAVLAVTDTVGLLYTGNPVAAAMTAKTLYLETQAEVYLKYVSATQMTMWSDAGFTTPVTATFSETAVPLYWATPIADALEACVDAALAIGHAQVLLPAGLLGLERNIVWTDANGLELRGRGRDLTILADLRKTSTELADAHVVANSDYGALSFFGSGSGTSDNIQLWDMSYDANLHTVGAAHSTGGVVNHSGGRIGFFMRNVKNPGFHRLGSQGGVGGFGARDEHIYHDTDCDNSIIEECVLGDALHPTNGPSMNPVSGEGVRIINNVAVSHFAALECSCFSPTVTGNHFSNYAVYPIGSETCIMAPRGRTIFCNNTIRDCDSRSSGVGAVIFGQGFYSNAVVICSDNVFANLLGLYGPGDDLSNLAGVLNIEGFNGTAYITNNTFDNVRSTASYPGGRFIVVRAPSAPCAGKIYIGGNVANANPVSGEDNMNVGIHVYGNVAPDVVVNLPGNDWAGCQFPCVFETAVGQPNGDAGEMLRGPDIIDPFPEVANNAYVYSWKCVSAFTVNAGTNVVTFTPSIGTVEPEDGQVYWLTTTSVLPAGLLRGRPFYVRDAGGSTCKFALTPGGAAGDITDTGFGVHTATREGGNRFVMQEGTMTGAGSVSFDGGGESDQGPEAYDVVRIEYRDTIGGFPLAVYWGGDLLYTFDGTKKEAADFRFQDGDEGLDVELCGKCRLI